jgi:SAM-dependent methyltransferase
VSRRRDTKPPGPGVINAAAREGFEHDFLSVPFAVHLLECETNAIAPYLREYLPMDGLILEVGSGSGRCVEWLHREGRQTIGLDWSLRRSAVAASHSEGGYFLAADMRAIPPCNESVAGLVSLGAIEHSVEGPASARPRRCPPARDPGCGRTPILIPNPSSERISPTRSPPS